MAIIGALGGGGGGGVVVFIVEFALEIQTFEELCKSFSMCFF